MPMDWVAWHDRYERDEALRGRLAIVQRHIVQALAAAPPGPVRVISMCAGDGRDLLGALSGHPRRRDIEARLVELEPRLAARARASSQAAGLDRIEVVIGDAGTTAAYAGAVPADLVLACGIFGNLTDAHIERTVLSLPMLCARGATAIWTRHRRPPDLTPAIRGWFAKAGFDEVAFEQVAGTDGSVGVARLAVAPAPFQSDVRLFRFVKAKRA